MTGAQTVSKKSILLFVVLLAACRARTAEDTRITASYDSKTGRLALLKYDSNGDGRPDTYSYMNGTRFLRIEIDADEDGKIDRWEYYDEAQKLEKVGVSRAGDGKQDAWLFFGPDGSIHHVDRSTRGDGRPNRKEFYEGGLLVSAEEDSDADGRADKWETWEGARLTAVAFDLARRGTPDRRIVYGADGSARLEIDTAGTGHFVPHAQPRDTVRPIVR